MKRKLCFLIALFCVLFSLESIAQPAVQTITGTVKNKSKNEALAGATITNERTGKSIVSNNDGTFSVIAKKGDVLSISYAGYKTANVLVKNETILEVALEEGENKLEEVIVVGYGTQKISKVSGAISTIKSADIEKLKPVRAEDAIQGRVSGVTVVTSGSPGSKPTVLIRGIPSYAGNDPLVVVDGVTQTLDDLNSINSVDIESINVLKDAAATAIYGVHGGNGVIVITTKNGRKNKKPEFSFSTNFGTQQVIRQIPLLNATEYGAIVNEGSLVDGATSPPFQDLSKLGVGTNWQSQVFHNATLQNHSISARGGGENISYFLSGAYTGQDGIIGGGDKSNFNRYNATGNFIVDLNSKLKVFVNTSFVNIKGISIPENGFNSVLGNALNFDPTVGIYNTIPNTYGKYSISNNILSENVNPLTQLADIHNKANTNKLYGKVELQYQIFKNIKLNSRYGYTNTDITYKSFTPLSYYGESHQLSTLHSDGSTVNGAHNTVEQSKTTYYNYSFENFGTYNFKIARDNNFEALLGISMSKSTSNAIYGSKKDVLNNSWDYAEIFAATGTAATSSISTSRSEKRNLSYFGRLNYDYKDKYLASFSLRRDGSSVFGPANKFGNFYAGSLGWVLSSEKFYKLKFIQFLKLRGSYGVTGNDNVSAQYQKISQIPYTYGLGQNTVYTFGDNTSTVGATILSYKNDALQWEKQKQFNIGFESRFFNNKVSLTADYFEKKTSQLLFQPALSLYLGTAQTPSANVGSTQTKGYDISLGYTNIFPNKLSFNSNVTFTTTKNLVTNAGTGAPLSGGYYGVQGQPVTRFEKGFAPAYFYGYKTNGLFQTQDEINKSATQVNAKPGDIKYVDVNGNGIINDSDKTNIGNPYPKFTLGWNISLEYKGIDLNLYIYASVGNDIYRAYERNSQYSNKYRGILSRWTGANSTNDAKHPRVTFADLNNNARVSDRYVEDGSFTKLKDVQIGYSLPKSLLKNKFFTKVRIYTQIKNALVFTKYTGYDPEISNGGLLETGIDRGAYPQARIYSMGLDLKF